jgi:hypothetical protein
MEFLFTDFHGRQARVALFRGEGGGGNIFGIDRIQNASFYAFSEIPFGLRSSFFRNIALPNPTVFFFLTFRGSVVISSSTFESLMQVHWTLISVSVQAAGEKWHLNSKYENEISPTSIRNYYSFARLLRWSTDWGVLCKRWVEAIAMLSSIVIKKNLEVWT